MTIKPNNEFFFTKYEIQFLEYNIYLNKSIDIKATFIVLKFYLCINIRKIVILNL